MKSLLIVALLFTISLGSAAQSGVGGQGTGVGGGGGPALSSGAPTGACSASQLDVDTTTGNFWTCKITAGVGTWLQAGGALILSDTPLTTRGDLLTVNSVPALSRLGIGVNHSIAQSNGLDIIESTTINPGKINGIFYVDGVKYSTLASAVTDAIAAGGGIIYDTIPEAFTSNPCAGISSAAPVEIHFGHGVWTTTVQIACTANLSKVYGMGEWNGNGGTAIQATGAFPTFTIANSPTGATCSGTACTITIASGTIANIANGSMVSVTGVANSSYNQSCIVTSQTTTSITCTMAVGGFAASGGGKLSTSVLRVGLDTQTHGAFYSNLTVDCQQVAGCSGILSSDANEYSGARDISIINWSGFCIDIETSAAGAAQNSNWENIECLPTASGTAASTGFRAVGTLGLGPTIKNINIVPNIGIPIGQCAFLANHTGGSATNLHCESSTSGVQLGDTTFGPMRDFTLINPSCDNNPGGATHINIPNNATTGNIAVIGERNNCTNAIVNSVTGHTITDAQIASYWVGTPPSPLECSSSSNLNCNLNIIIANVGSIQKIQMPEQGAQAGGAGVSVIYADSGIHQAQLSNNGGSMSPIATNSTFAAPPAIGSTTPAAGSFTTVKLSSTISNVANTATMGLTLKKGSGGGNYSSASTTYAVVDSTNLCFTVTIPSGWKLGIVVNGAIGTATGVAVASLALTDNAACSTANAGILVETTETTTAAAVLQPVSLGWVISGDGASHNVALQYKTANGADSATIANSSATLLPTMVFTLMPSN